MNYKFTNKNKKVFVALSGGVDSSVAAALLKKQNFNVIGVFMKNWSNFSGSFKVGNNKIGCVSEKDAEDARRAAEALNIPFYVFDFENEYRQQILKYMIEGYKNGITPNPDVLCNKKIKFGLFLKKALEMGADYIATGHYIKKIKNQKSKVNEYKLYIAKDKNKDQSYFLWTLTQDQLKYCLFPLGNYIKPEVRKLAKKFKLPTAMKKDSQGLCFIGKINLREFLKQWIPEKQGNIIDINGKILGKHPGVWFFTIGQRHGFNLAGGPYFVVKKDVKRNNLIVAKDNDKSLFSKKIIVSDLNWISGQMPKFPLQCLVRIRYRQPLQQAKLVKVKNKKLKVKSIEIKFTEPQRAVAKGQSAVFYKKNGEMIGGGIIVS